MRPLVRPSGLIVLSALFAATVAHPAHAQIVGRADVSFTWRGRLPSGVLVVRNHNGPIEVRPASGSDVEFRAEKHLRGGSDPGDVGFDIRTEGNGDVRICSTYLDNNPCDGERRWSSGGGDHRPITVSMVLLVPRSARVKLVTGNGTVLVERVGAEVTATTGNGRVTVRETDGAVRATTGNGDVDVRGARGRVHVTTGNGDVTVTTTEGPVDARSGNGDIDVRMSSLKAREEMHFTTGSGQVRLTLPSNYSGELDASTGNGDIRSDFDLAIKGRINPRRIHATIGEGGPLLRLSTGNGSLELLKAP